MSTLFDLSLLHKLGRLSLVARHVRAGQATGERRSTKRGTSVEFADYRDYTRGDDLRRVDWNIYARLDRPFVKLFEEEEDLAVHLLLDGSGSMDWGGEGEQRRGGAGDVNIQMRLKMSKERFLQIRVKSLEKELATCNDEKKKMHDAIHGYGGYEDVIKGYKKKGVKDAKSLEKLRIFDMPKGYRRAQTKYTVVDHKRRKAEVQRGLPEGISPGSSVKVAKIGYNPYKGKVRGARRGDNYLIEHDHTGLRETVPSRFVTKI